MKTNNQNIEIGKDQHSAFLPKRLALLMLLSSFIYSSLTVFAGDLDSISNALEGGSVGLVPPISHNDYFSLQVKVPIVSTKEVVEEDKIIKVFPNPSNGIFQITCLSDQQYIEVFNSLGGSVYKANCDTYTQIVNLTGYPKGIYYIHVVDKNNKYRTLSISNE